MVSAVSIIKSDETTRGASGLGRARRLRRRAGLQPKPRPPGRGVTRDRSMDRRRCLPVGGRQRMRSRGRVWPRSLPAADHPFRRDVRHRRHLSFRSWADLDRAGAARTLLGRRGRFTRDAECDAERIPSGGGLLHGADDSWNVPHSLCVAMVPGGRSSANQSPPLPLTNIGH